MSEVGREQAESLRGGLDTVYLVVGTDEYKRRIALERMDKRLSSAGDVEFNREVINGDAAPDPSALRASLDTLPFGSDFRLVVVKDVDKAPKAFTEEIVGYLGNPNPTTVLVMTANKLAKSTRLYKAVVAASPKGIVECEPRKRSELPALVCTMARNKGKRMDERTAELLIQYVGESTTLIETELRKLASAVGERPSIECSDIEHLVARVAEPKPWDFMDAVCRRDVRGALEILALMRSQSPMGLHTLIVTRLRQLITAKALDQRGTPGLLATELGLQTWQVKNHMTWARGFTMRELVAALRGAAVCERELKSTPDKMLAIQRWVISFCPKG